MSQQPERPTMPLWVPVVVGLLAILGVIWLLSAIVGFFFGIIRFLVILAVVVAAGWFFLSRSRR